MRLFLAIRAFFAVLFGGALPQELMPAVPEIAPGPTQTPAAAPPQPVVAKPPQENEPKPAESPAKAAPNMEASAVRALSVLQAEGRLLDFLSEDIETYSDGDIGAAVREIHRGCRRALKDHFAVSHVRAEAEDSRITVPEGYDPSEIRLVGNVVGKPPFQGTLKHRGWRVGEVKLPTSPLGAAAKVIVPAEVEVS